MYKQGGMRLNDRVNSYNLLAGQASLVTPTPTATPTPTPTPTATTVGPTPTPTSPPSPPTGLSACCIEAAGGGNYTVYLQWNPVYGQGYYQVWHSVSPGSTTLYAGGNYATNSTRLGNFVGGNTYYFAVGVGGGPYGSLVSVTF